MLRTAFVGLLHMFLYLFFFSGKKSIQALLSTAINGNNTLYLQLNNRMNLENWLFEIKGKLNLKLTKQPGCLASVKRRTRLSKPASYGTSLQHLQAFSSHVAFSDIKSFACDHNFIIDVYRHFLYILSEGMLRWWEACTAVSPNWCCVLAL